MDQHGHQHKARQWLKGHRMAATLVLCALALALLGGWLHQPDLAPGPPARALDSGEGGGRVVALDLSPETVERLRRQLAQAGQVLAESDEGLVAIKRKHKLDTDDSASSPVPAPPPLAPGQRPMIAVVIDDLGLARDRTLAAIGLPGPLTLAFLPYADGVADMARAARAGGHELLVHLPMEPSRGSADPGPNALLTGLDVDENRKRLLANLASFEGFDGINNHMGSRFTQSRADMDLVLKELRARDLFFLDSRTTAASAARSAALDARVPYAERDVFLDNHQEAPYLALQLSEVERIARRNGSVIAIGHPHGVTIAALRLWLGGLSAKGFDLVPVSRIVDHRQGPAARVAQQRPGTSG